MKHVLSFLSTFLFDYFLTKKIERDVVINLVSFDVKYL